MSSDSNVEYLRANLNIITDERVIDDNPESHSGSMSSMKNLDDTYNFGDQFLYDKPRESDASASKQHPALTLTGWQITDTRDDVVNSLMHMLPNNIQITDTILKLLLVSCLSDLVLLLSIITNPASNALTSVFKLTSNVVLSVTKLSCLL
ncbi:hypothetical protein Tco_1270081 [Tanacetum coccineum]